MRAAIENLNFEARLEFEKELKPVKPCVGEVCIFSGQEQHIELTLSGTAGIGAQT